MALRMILSTAFLAVVILLPACSETAAETTAAVRTFEAFQEALFGADRPALRRLVTDSSRPAIDDLPFDDLESKEPLQVLGAERDGADFLVRVTDPNRGGEPGTYVVVRQGGRLRVDLLATTALHHEEVPYGDGTELVPKALTPADIERARAANPEAFK